MDPEPLSQFLRSLRRCVGAPGAARLSDAELLKRFVARRDEAAFELLLWRHGPMVLGLCRRLLADPDDVEDAFQATFLALARKAASISRAAAVGGWLYRVAYRVALRARAEAARRARRQQPGVERLAAPPGDGPDRADLRRVLDEEVNRLPERYRTAFVLCCVEGLTTEEAARQLACPPGTVSSRVTRARQRLRSRLLRRGLAPSAGAVAAALTGDAWAIPVQTPLVGSTLKAALWFTAGGAARGVLRPPAVALAEGVLKAMLLTKLKLAALLLLVAGSLALGGILARRGAEAAPPPQEGNPSAQGPRTEEKRLAVEVARPLLGPMERTAVQSCSVHAFDQEDVFASVPGVLQSLAVDLGSFVRKGQLLAVIDAPLLVLEEKQAAAALDQAMGRVMEGQAGLAAAKAEVEAAHTVVRERQAAVASARLPQSSLENARADVQVKRSRVMQAEAVVAIARANVEAARIVLEKARYTLGLTRVLSPIDGVVTRRNYQNGHQIRAGEPGERLPLVTVQQTDPVRVVAQVSDAYVLLARPGTPAVLYFSALPGIWFAGYKVSRIGFVEDPNGTMRAEIDVPNPEQLLRPGMSGTATLRLQIGSPQSLWVPASSLVALPMGKAVYVVRDGKAQRKQVQTGASVFIPVNPGRSAAVVEISSGLKPADRIVTDPGRLAGEAVPVRAKEGPALK